MNAPLDVSYFARFEAEGPLDHLWSLSVEEQFYIVWPFLLLLGVKLVHERPLPSGVRPRLALLTIAGAMSGRAMPSGGQLELDVTPR